MLKFKLRVYQSQALFIDTGSDITMISEELFKVIINSAQLNSEAFRPANRRACTYNGQPIVLDGQMVVTITFGPQSLEITI